MGTTVATAMTVQAIAAVRREIGCTVAASPGTRGDRAVSLVVGGLTMGNWNRCRGGRLRAVTVGLQLVQDLLGRGLRLARRSPVALTRVRASSRVRQAVA